MSDYFVLENSLLDHHHVICVGDLASVAESGNLIILFFPLTIHLDSLLHIPIELGEEVLTVRHFVSEMDIFYFEVVGTHPNVPIFLFSQALFWREWNSFN